MDSAYHRKVTRSQVWPGIEATVRVLGIVNRRSCFSIIKGSVKDLGSSGMFLITPEMVPVPMNAEIEIDFNSQCKGNNLKITALGKTVHSTDEGVGIKFTSIDLSKLQECIVFNINRMNSI